MDQADEHTELDIMLGLTDAQKKCLLKARRSQGYTTSEEVHHQTLNSLENQELLRLISGEKLSDLHADDLEYIQLTHTGRVVADLIVERNREP